MSDKSQFLGCYIAAREGETLFSVQPDGKVIVNLVGYAVVPVESYKDYIEKVADLADELEHHQQDK